MAGPGIPLNLDFYRPPSRPSTPLTARGASGGYAAPILTMPPPSAPSSSAPQMISTPMGSIPAQGPYARSAPSNVEPAFEFTVPSLPPRLANFGRKISQMSTDFIAEFDDAPPTRKSLEAQAQAKRAPSLGDAVPGMGDEPVMCPFCEKPLPPALLAGHAHGHAPGSKAANASAAMKTTSSLAGPGLKRSNTTTAVQTRGSLRSEGARKAGLLDALPVEETSAPRSTSVPAGKTVEKVRTGSGLTISAEEMRREEAEADGTNISSAKVVVSEDDLRRWSLVAGIEPPKPVNAQTQVTSAPSGGQVVPKLDPPPASGRPSASRASSSSSKFGFFGRKANPKKDLIVDDDSDDEGGLASGYSRLLAGGSDTESDGDDDGDRRARSRSRKAERDDKTGALHDEPGHMTPEEGTSAGAVEATPTRATAVPETPAESSAEDLKNVLREVLAKLNEMSQSHTALHSSQTTLLTSLKIARSNLAMAEANTEMLEAQLKQQQKATSSPAPASAPGSAQPRSAGVPATPLAQPRAVPASATIAGRSDLERQNHRPMSLQMPAGTSAPEKGGWGFWNNGKKKLQDAAQAFPANFPSPSMEKRSFDFEQYVAGSSATNGNPAARSKEVNRISSEGANSMVRSASYSNLDAARSPPRTTSLAQNAAGAAATTAHTAELAKVRELYATAEKKIDAMSKELAELKKGKVEMEAELENLSQALFEEANKMVADERKKRAEVEEALKEVKEEREALKQTIKVLDGQAAADDGAIVESVKSARSVAGADGSPKAEEDLPEEFQPRDLDKHYEALRRSIHHVSDGATDGPGEGFLSALSVPETIPEGSRAGSGSASGTDSRAESTRGDNDGGKDESAGVMAEPTVAPPLDPNPWANPSPFGVAEPAGTEAKLPGEEQLQVRSSGEAPRSPVEDLDRLMERLQADMKE